MWRLHSTTQSALSPVWTLPLLLLLHGEPQGQTVARRMQRIKHILLAYFALGLYSGCTIEVRSEFFSLFFPPGLSERAGRVSLPCHMLQQQAGWKHVYVESGDACLLMRNAPQRGTLGKNKAHICIRRTFRVHNLISLTPECKWMESEWVLLSHFQLRLRVTAVWNPMAWKS